MRAEPTPAKHDRQWRRAVRGYLLLPHLVPVLVVELATAAFAVIAWHGLPPLRVLAPLLLAMLGGQLAIGASNEIIDLPLDMRTKPEKPLVRGDVSVRGARLMAGAGLVLMTVFGLKFGAKAFVLLAIGTGLGFAYNFWCKQTPWSWLPYFLALPLLPIWVFVALNSPAAPLLFLYPLGALATVGVHFAQALPDVGVDREAGLRNTSSKLGEERTFAAAWIMTLSAPGLAWLVATWVRLGGHATTTIAAGGLGIVLFTVNVALLASNRRTGIAAAFPLVALSTLASGLAWAITVAE